MSGHPASLPRGASAGAGTKLLLAPGERIDLNRAPLSELLRLPGVGRKKALALLAYRERSPFLRPEDVGLVRGFGPRWLRRASGSVTVGEGARAAPLRGAPPR